VDKEQRVEVDLTPFACEAFASNPKVYKLIKRLYEKNRVKYYQTAKSSRWYKNEILTSQSIQKEIVAKQTLALLLEGEVEDILQIIRTGWPAIYHWAKKQSSISVDDALALMMPSRSSKKEDLDRLTNDEINSYAVVALLLANILGKKIEENKGHKVLMHSLYQRLKWAEGENRIRYASLPGEEKARIRQLKKDVYAQARINRFFVSFADSTGEDVQKAHNALCFLFDTERLSTSLLEDEQLAEQDIDEVLAVYTVAYSDTSNIEDVAHYLVFGHAVKGLLRAYRHLKEQHFKTSRETLYLELDTAEYEAREAKEAAAFLSKTVSQQEKEIAALRKQVAGEYSRAVAEYRVELKAAQAENLDLKERCANLHDRVKELEDILFAREEGAGEGTDTNLVDLSLVRGIVVGGHQRWHSRIREVLPPSWRLIHPDEEIDLAVIAGADLVLFFIGYLSHAMYYLVADEAKRRGVPVGYLRKTNPAECAEEIKREVAKIKNN
jgi:hypothetical protein